MPNFHYSAALKTKGGTWTFDALNKWITNPRADVPGTAMTFPGISNEKQRADVVAYLNTVSAHPLPTARSAGAPAAPPAAGAEGKSAAAALPQLNAQAPAPKVQ
jgi:cytochrome c